MANEIGFPYKAHSGLLYPRIGNTVTSTTQRLDLSPTSISRTTLASNQALFNDTTNTDPVAGNFSSCLNALFSLTTSTTPNTAWYNPPYNTETDVNNCGTPLYNMPSGTTRVGVYAGGGQSGLQSAINSVPMPDPSQIKDGSGTVWSNCTDKSMAILCGKEYWEFWSMSIPAPGSPAALAGYSWSCQDGAYIADVTSFNGVWSNVGWGVAAAGTAKLFGMLRAEDYYGGAINHALAIAWPCTGNVFNTSPPSGLGYGYGSQFLAPATRYDAQNQLKATGNIAAVQVPEGAWFRLPSTFNSTTWANANANHCTTSVLYMVCEALRNYGMIIVDSAGVIQFEAELNKTFGTPYNPYATAPNWGNFGQDLPWSQMVQIAARNAF